MKKIMKKFFTGVYALVKSSLVKSGKIMKKFFTGAYALVKFFPAKLGKKKKEEKKEKKSPRKIFNISMVLSAMGVMKKIMKKIFTGVYALVKFFPAKLGKKKKEEKKEKKSPRKIFDIPMVLSAIGIIFMFALFLRASIILSPYFIFGEVVLILILVKRIRIYSEEVAVIWQFLGRYYKTAKKGIHFLPFFAKERESVRIWEQSLEIFVSSETKIDFKGGGTAKPNGAVTFFKILSPYEAVYGVRNLHNSIKDYVESFLRSFYSKMTVEEALMSPPPAPGEIPEWGVEITKVVISDFGLDETTLQSREELFAAQKKAMAAKFEIEKKSLQIAGLHKKISEFLRGLGYPPEEANKISLEYVKYFQGTETGQLFDLRQEGGEGLLPLLAAFVANKKKE